MPYLLITMTWGLMQLFLPSLTDHLRMISLQGGSVTLPCGIPSVKSCSTVSWLMGESFGTLDEVVKAGRVTAPSGHRHTVLKDCSLEITHLVLDDARFYLCQSESLNSSVSLQLLQSKWLVVVPHVIFREHQKMTAVAFFFHSPVAEGSSTPEGKMELQCFLNTFKGYIPCNENNQMRIQWSAEDDTPINGSRFRFESPSDCFSKLFINTKLTDHHRKWKCHLTQKDEVKATLSYTTTIRGEK